MSTINAKCLYEAQFVNSVVATVYTCSVTNTIIDKFTATNTDSGSQTLTVYLCISGATPTNSNMIVKALSISAGTTQDFTSLQNQILNQNDFIAVLAGTADKINIRISGREIS